MHAVFLCEVGTEYLSQLAISEVFQILPSERLNTNPKYKDDRMSTRKWKNCEEEKGMAPLLSTRVSNSRSNNLFLLPV